MNQVGLGLEREVNSTSKHQGGQEDVDPSPTWEAEVQTLSNPELGSPRLSPESHNSAQFDPSLALCVQCKDCWPISASTMVSKKRLREDFGRFGRNLRPRHLCGFFSKVDIGQNQKGNSIVEEDYQAHA